MPKARQLATTPVQAFKMKLGNQIAGLEDPDVQEGSKQTSYNGSTSGMKVTGTVDEGI